MHAQPQIKAYLTTLPDAKKADMEAIHDMILHLAPGAKLWFEDGLNAEGKAVANPTIGYGLNTMHYAGGKTRQYFSIGLAANATGISLYLITVKDKKTLGALYGPTLGKATVTDYCIRFNKLADVSLPVLEDAIRYAFANESS